MPQKGNLNRPEDFMKKYILIILMTITTSLFANGVSESQAKLDVEDSRKEYDKLSSKKDLKKYLPYREFYFAKIYSQIAEKWLKDGDYEKGSYYGVLSQTFSQSAIALASAWKSEYEIMKLERDYYKKIVDTDTTWVSVALLEAGLKRKGKSKNFEGDMDVETAFGFKKYREPATVDGITDLQDKARNALEKIYKVLKKQEGTSLIITAFASRDNRWKKTTELSEAYGKKVKDFLIELGGIEESRISVEAKGWKKEGEINLTLKGVEAK